MKEKLEELLKEIQDRKDYYLRRVDDPNFSNMQQSYIGHYIELKEMEKFILEILGEDNDQRRIY